LPGSEDEPLLCPCLGRVCRTGSCRFARGGTALSAHHSPLFRHQVLSRPFVRHLIAALLQPNGAPIPLTRLQRLGESARVPFPGTSWIRSVSPNAGLLSVERNCSAQALPLAFGERDGVVLLLDGAIDNRRELSRELGREPLPEKLADPQLLLAAYLWWGIDFLPRIVGEFALILWDGRHQKMIAARDALGVGELFYTCCPKTIAIATQVWQLTPLRSSCRQRFDEAFLVEFLSTFRSFRERTALVGIRRLLAGHALVVNRDGWKVFPFWNWPSSNSGVSVPGRELSEAFLHLFREAIERQCAPDRRSWAELSGGIDSSAIVGNVRALQESGRLARGDYATVTLTWPDTPESDERQWVVAVLDHLDIPGHFVNAEDLFFDGAEAAARYRNDPHFGILCAPFLRAEADLLAAHGVEILLSGARAEAVLLDVLPPPFHFFQLCEQGRWAELLPQLRKWQRSSGISYPNLLVAGLLRPWWAAVTQGSLASFSPPPPWLRPEVSRRHGFSDLLRSGLVPRRHDDPVLQYQYEVLQRSESLINRGDFPLLVEIRHPYLYRPLAELCLRAPWSEKVDPVYSKVLLRRAMKGLLPEAVRLRRDWKSPTTAAFAAFRRRWGGLRSLGEGSLLVQMGVIDRAKWLDALRLARHGHSDHFVALTSTLALDIWLQAAREEPAGEIPARTCFVREGSAWRDVDDRGRRGRRE